MTAKADRDRSNRIQSRKRKVPKETTKKGWATCGWNGKLRVHMGYAEVGPCMREGCEEQIDHGLSYVCGGVHRGGPLGCGRYVCESHLMPLYLFGFAPQVDGSEKDSATGLEEFCPSTGMQLCPECRGRHEKLFDLDNEPYLDMERA